jgi:hypothetical protein
VLDPRYASIADPSDVDAISTAAMFDAHLRAMAANG